MLDMERSGTTNLSQSDLQTFVEVDEVVGRALAMGDPLYGLEYGRMLKKGAALKSYALAKLLYRMQEGWNIFQSAGVNDDFYQLVEDYVGNAPETTKKYVRMWRNIFENQSIPEDIKRQLLGKPIADTLLLTAGAGDGTLDEDVLRRAAMAEDNGALKEIIRQKRGDVTSSSSAVRLFIVMRDRGDIAEGTIYAQRGDEREVLGFLYPPKSELGHIGFDRLTRDMKELY